MGKLNYLNRKSEGIKLGQIVAKDLRKRIKPATSSAKHEPHRDTSPLEILLEGKNLTDGGLQEAAQGLEEALSVTDAKLGTRLQLLNLSRNGLTCTSLYRLSTSIRLASNDLEELDLSQNEIRVESDDDASQWETFLDALRQCSVLRKLNLSGNCLAGTRPFEILARVYASHFRQNIARWTEGDEAAMEELGLIDSAANGLANLEIFGSPTSDSSRRADRELAFQGRGLPSIHTINVSDSSLTDGGALFLSYILEQHRWFQDKICSAGTMSPSAQSSTGFVTFPNEQLGAVGMKLLKAATTSQYELKRWTSPVDENVCFQKRGSSVTSASSKNFPAVNGHRRISSNSQLNADVGPSPTRPTHQSNELDTLRRKLQRTLLEDQGVQTIELWGTALRLLTYARAVLLEKSPLSKFDEFRADSSQESRRRKQSVPISPGHVPNGYASKLEIHPSSTEPVMVITGVTTERRTPSISTAKSNGHHVNGKPHFNFQAHEDESFSGAVKLNGCIRMPAPEKDLVGGLPRRSWESILAKLVDPDDILSDRQRHQIATWASSRRTLTSELELLGKPTPVQIWKALDAMGCLEYESM